MKNPLTGLLVAFVVALAVGLFLVTSPFPVQAGDSYNPDCSYELALHQRAALSALNRLGAEGPPEVLRDLELALERSSGPCGWRKGSPEYFTCEGD